MRRSQVNSPGESCATCGLTSVGVSSAEADMAGFRFRSKKFLSRELWFEIELDRLLWG
jgi:hypothetical protein